MTAILILTISVGVQDRPSAAPQTGPWEKNITAFKSATILDGIGALVTAICKLTGFHGLISVGYCGTPIFFGVVSEMKNPGDFNKSLAVCQSIVITTYLCVTV